MTVVEFLRKNYPFILDNFYYGKFPQLSELDTDKKINAMSPEEIISKWYSITVFSSESTIQTMLLLYWDLRKMYDELVGEKKECNTCKGKGRMPIEFGIPDYWTDCESCDGKGFNMERNEIKFSEYEDNRDG